MCEDKSLPPSVRIATLEGECERLQKVVLEHDEKMRALGKSAGNIANQRDELRAIIWAVYVSVDPLGALASHSLERGELPTKERLVELLLALQPKVVAAYVRDRQDQYVPSSGIYDALGELAAKLQAGEHVEAYRHGELDDLIRE